MINLLDKLEIWRRGTEKIPNNYKPWNTVCTGLSNLQIEQRMFVQFSVRLSLNYILLDCPECSNYFCI